MTEAEQKENPFTVNKIHAEKIIKEELYEKIHQDDSENHNHLWKTLIEDNEKENQIENIKEKEKENISIEKIKSPVKLIGNQENEPENISEKAGKKPKKKTQRTALASNNENVPSWRKEFDKMYQ